MLVLPVSSLPSVAMHDISTLPIRLGTAIRKMRVLRGLSQEKLAEISALHRTYIGAVERGEKNITVYNVARIAVSLDCTLVELFAFLEPSDV